MPRLFCGYRREEAWADRERKRREKQAASWERLKQQAHKRVEGGE